MTGFDPLPTGSLRQANERTVAGAEATLLALFDPEIV